MKLFGTMEINKESHLEIGSIDSTVLAKDYGTPLYVMDEELIRTNCREFKKSFMLDDMDTEVIYASKAFLNLAMCRLINEENLSLDVVSGGELYTALKANFPMERIFMHGNNKTYDELQLAVKSDVGRIVIDNRGEFELLEEICESLDSEISVILRVNPGIDAHTHEYIQTSKHDSKFGISIFSEDIYEMIKVFKSSKRVNFKGFHCHIGSQIFDTSSFYAGAMVMMDFLHKIKENCNFQTTELNLGGGFGVYYSEEDSPVDIDECLKTVLKTVKDEANRLNLIIPRVIIEPGRSIVANAGTTLYTVGEVKETYGGKTYAFIDGGMGDNPRTALYGAIYEAAVVNKMNCDGVKSYAIAGKCCESGDIIIKEITLPEIEKGDIIAVSTTGAYNYSMSSNYNRIPKPAVVFVKNGEVKIVVKRETYEDLIRNDIL